MAESIGQKDNSWIAELARYLERADGLEVDFSGHELEPHQVRLIRTLGVHRIDCDMGDDCSCWVSSG